MFISPLKNFFESDLVDVRLIDVVFEVHTHLNGTVNLGLLK